MPPPRPTAAAAAPALAAAAAIGPYFAWEAWSPAASWRPFTDLLTPSVARDRVAVARSTLVGAFGLSSDDVPARVVASIYFMGVASRLLSPPYGAAVAGGALPQPSRANLWWRPVAAGPVPIAYGAVPAVSTAGAAPAEIASMLVTVPLAETVTPLLELFRAEFRLSPKVLWGNVASALAGAAGVLADTMPRHAARAGAVLDHALALPPLAGSGTVVRPAADPRRFLVRANCCLYYRIPGGGTCADCVLTSDADRREQWAALLG
ncbi:(2Fe-2S)-binding protein [Asanoa sp. WMMD1127]|uniref:(2Fe-2S)-binding protein n=1 Tax=Asanoa sp. WMMD1127 TaxID=3016107 RepID=UPI002416FF2D|nr:(2Fe-2S)-binding protein [Asanoa sp. WMMD1127]MDG4824057.1 (2Fe-2S)-binding protein [Asanoa sp. WMMD1127]